MKSSILEKETKDVSSAKKEDALKAYPFYLLQRDMNQLFDDFTRGMSLLRPRFADSFFNEVHVKVDYKEKDDRIMVTAELPGVDPIDLDVVVDTHSLTISGEKKEEEEREDKEHGFHTCERRYGSFSRIIPLPFEIDRHNVEATFRNGVLKITMPKCKEAIKSAKRVDIKTDH